MFQKKWPRQTVGTILGGCAGLSLTTTILPTVVTTMRVADSFIIRWALSDYAAHTSLLWAVAGCAVGTSGSPRFGTVILGGIGGLSGILLTIFALKPTSSLLLGCGLSGAVYGAIGGLLLGTVLQSPTHPERG